MSPGAGGGGGSTAAGGRGAAAALPVNTYLPESVARGVIRDVTAALALLHSTGIAHRDVKPENVQVVATIEPPGSHTGTGTGFSSVYGDLSGSASAIGLRGPLASVAESRDDSLMSTSRTSTDETSTGTGTGSSTSLSNDWWRSMTPSSIATLHPSRLRLRAVLLDLGFAHVTDAHWHWQQGGRGTAPSATGAGSGASLSGSSGLDASGSSASASAIDARVLRTLFGTKHAAAPELWLAADAATDAATGKTATPSSSSTSTPSASASASPLASLYSGVRVDAWGLGVVAYVCLMGQLPFDASGGAAELKENICAGRIRTTGSGTGSGSSSSGSADAGSGARWNQLSPQARDFVLRLLAVKPEERMTPTEALRHPWFNDGSSGGT